MNSKFYVNIVDPWNPISTAFLQSQVPLSRGEMLLNSTEVLHLAGGENCNRVWVLGAAVNRLVRFQEAFKSSRHLINISWSCDLENEAS